jgi:hypothetical protein
VAVVAESAPSKMGIARAPAPNTTRLGGRHASRVARALVAGIAVTLAPFIASAAGTGEAVSLTWNSPAGCPDRGAVLERLRSLLVVSKVSGEQVTAQGTVVGGPPSGTWELNLETVQGERTWKRTINSASCDELADAAALIIALVVDPDLMTEAQANAGAVTQKPPSPTVPTLPATPPVSPAPPVVALPEQTEQPAQLDKRRTPIAFVVGGAAVVDLGSLPGASFGAELAIGMRLAHAQIDALGMFFPSTETVIRADPKSGGDLGLIGGGVRGCYWAPSPTWGWGVCAGIELGSMRGEGFGTDFTGTEARLWAATRLGAFATYPLAKSLAFRASLEGLLPVTRPTFELVNVGTGTVHQPSIVSGRLQLGIEAHFE